MESAHGFIVDKFNIVLRIDKSIIEPKPQFVGKIDKNFISGIATMADNLLILLDMDYVKDNSEFE